MRPERCRPVRLFRGTSRLRSARDLSRAAAEAIPSRISRAVHRRGRPAPSRAGPPRATRKPPLPPRARRPPPGERDASSPPITRRTEGPRRRRWHGCCCHQDLRSEFGQREHRVARRILRSDTIVALQCAIGDLPGYRTGALWTGATGSAWTGHSVGPFARSPRRGPSTGPWHVCPARRPLGPNPTAAGRPGWCRLMDEDPGLC